MHENELDPDLIRSAVASIDAWSAELERYVSLPDDGYEVTVALGKLREARHALKDIGHNAHFDTPNLDALATEPEDTL